MAERINYLKEKDDRMVGDHVYRYWNACVHLDNTDELVVVDAGCGFGFGSHILSGFYKNVIGLDYSKEAIDYAVNNFICDFRVVDLNTCSLPNADVLCCFEVLEHLENYNNVVKQFNKFKYVFVSVPIIKTTHTNKFHVNDFDKFDFLNWFDGFSIDFVKYQHDDVYIFVCGRRLN